MAQTKLAVAVRDFLDRFDELVLCRDAVELDIHLKTKYYALCRELKKVTRGSIKP